MLRITSIESPGRLTLKLEGKLLGAWVDELRAASQPLTTFIGERALDLADLTFIDDAGVRQLRDLTDQGMRITSCSQFVSELLHTVQP